MEIYFLQTRTNKTVKTSTKSKNVYRSRLQTHTQINTRIIQCSLHEKIKQLHSSSYCLCRLHHVFRSTRSTQYFPSQPTDGLRLQLPSWLKHTDHIMYAYIDNTINELIIVYILLSQQANFKLMDTHGSRHWKRFYLNVVSPISSVLILCFSTQISAQAMFVISEKEIIQMCNYR